MEIAYSRWVKHVILHVDREYNWYMWKMQIDMKLELIWWFVHNEWYGSTLIYKIVIAIYMLDLLLKGSDGLDVHICEWHRNVYVYIYLCANVLKCFAKCISVMDLCHWYEHERYLEMFIYVNWLCSIICDIGFHMMKNNEYVICWKHATVIIMELYWLNFYHD